MENENLEQEREEGFEQFRLSGPVLKSVAAMGYVAPTEVQSQTIPLVFSGKDLIVQSRTGTGKTAAFGIPMVERVEPGMLLVQGLVLTPTRELTLQVAEEIGRIGRDRGVRALTVYGGDSMDRQIEGIREGAQIIVGTPGRVLDHLKRKTLSFSSVKLVVLDEADRMLDMGFYKEMKQIFDFLPGQRQTLLFSATFPKAIEALTYNYLHEPERILLSQDYVYVKEVDHTYLIVSAMHKDRVLHKLLIAEDPHSALIFCNTRQETRLVFQYLWKRGVPVEMLSSDLPQKTRERVMGRMRNREIRFLVTTDVAARGIDLEDLSHVFIFTTPSSPDQYVHRAGRTGRVGKSGKAITLLGASDLINFNRMVNVNELEVREIEPPSDAEVEEKLRGRRLEELAARAEGLSPEDRLQYEGLANALIERTDLRNRILTLLLKEALERREPERRPESAETAEAMQVPALREHRGEYRGRRDRGPRDRRPRSRGRGPGAGPRILPAPQEAPAPAPAPARASAPAPSPPSAPVQAGPGQAAVPGQKRRRRRRRRGRRRGGQAGPPEIAGEGVAGPETS